MPLTATAMTVEMPASVRTGNGSLDPEPWPRSISGEVSIKLRGVMYSEEDDRNSGCGA